MAGLEKSFVSTTPAFLVTSHIIHVKRKASYRFKRAFLIQQRTRVGTHTKKKKKTAYFCLKYKYKGKTSVRRLRNHLVEAKSKFTEIT